MFSPGAVFISPHHDDVCFSLAATVLACRGGQLINVFSRSDYAVGKLSLAAEGEERIARVTDLRIGEDWQFADRCGLSRHDLMLEDAPLRGVQPFDLSNLEIEVARLNAALIGRVAALRQATGGNKPALFCPMGIGGHRDHVLVLMSVVSALPKLRELFELYFYEDLHYASHARFREAGLLRFSGILAGVRLSRKVLALPPELFARKMSLVGIYASQHTGQVQAPDYIPASADFRKPHEAVWGILPET